MAPISLTPTVARSRPRKHTRLPFFGVWILGAIPSLMVLTCGILILIYRQSAFDSVMGLLLVVFSGTLGAGVTLTVIGIRRERRLAALQIDFVSKVSHELKTPLTSIRMFVETLKLGRVKEPERVAQCLEVLAKETERLSILIGRLLSWGAMEAGAYKIEKAPIHPSDLVHAAMETFSPQIAHTQAQVEIDLAPELPTIEGDQSALVDALINLLTNALRYGGEQKRIALIARQRGVDKVEIAVQDWGIGIEGRHQRRIFERFYRADERLSRAVGGTGLGLAIARHIITAHGGFIELKSRLGEGSTFTVVLPSRPLPAAIPADKEAPA